MFLPHKTPDSCPVIWRLSEGPKPKACNRRNRRLPPAEFHYAEDPPVPGPRGALTRMRAHPRQPAAGVLEGPLPGPLARHRRPLAPLSRSPLSPVIPSMAKDPGLPLRINSAEYPALSLRTGRSRLQAKKRTHGDRPVVLRLAMAAKARIGRSFPGYDIYQFFLVDTLFYLHYISV